MVQKPSPLPDDSPEADLSALAALAEATRREPGAFPHPAALVKASGLGAAQLDSLFASGFHTTPDAFLERARVEAVGRGLLAGRRAPKALAGEAGWEGDFADRFRRATGLSPEDYRRIPRERGFVLDLPRGYRAGETLRYLGRDPESRSERVMGASFGKGVRLDGRPALLTVEVERGAARCRIETPGPLSPAAAARAHTAALRLLGLALDPAPFERRVRRTPELARLIAGRAGLRLPLAAEVFEGLTWAIVGQQVNLAFAATLRRRVVELCGEPIPGAANAGPILAPPSPAAVAGLAPRELTSRQFSGRKAEYLIDTARAIAAGELPVERFPEEPAPLVERRILAVRGLGPWTAQYVMLRACGFADCVPVGDSGLAAGLVRFFALDHRPGPEETRELLAPFAPFRSFATAHLWASLGDTP